MLQSTQQQFLYAGRKVKRKSLEGRQEEKRRLTTSLAKPRREKEVVRPPPSLTKPGRGVGRERRLPSSMTKHGGREEEV